jgi:ubiquinone/menaquinone biosynthesis C-methylase UbiE
MDQNIGKMNYSEFVGLVKERNRPSGGIKTVHSVAVNALLMGQSKRMLEIGSNTGFTSVNMSLLTGCSAVGTDINDASISEAKEYAIRQGVEDRVSFIKADVLNLPFEDNSFDVVWCSNVTSFISDKDKVVSEYLRVLKMGGILVIVPIYYLNNPPKAILQKVSDAIGAQVTVRNKNDWKSLFEGVAEKNSCALELFYEEDCKYHDVKDRIEFYIDLLMKKESVMNRNKDEQIQIKNDAEYFYNLFNENLQYAGYSILLYQKRRVKDEVELFLTERL